MIYLRMVLWVSFFVICPSSEAYMLKNQSEALHISIPEDWRLAHSSETNGQKLYKWVPVKQQISAWQEMITVQYIPNSQSMGFTTPIDFAQQKQKTYRHKCQKLNTHPPGMRKENGYDTSVLMMVCHYAVNDAEYLMTKVIQGQYGYYVIERHIRFNPAEKDMPAPEELRENILPIMHTSHVCDQNNPVHSCPTITEQAKDLDTARG